MSTLFVPTFHCDLSAPGSDAKRQTNLPETILRIGDVEWRTAEWVVVVVDEVVSAVVVVVDVVEVVVGSVVVVVEVVVVEVVVVVDPECAGWKDNGR
jgi:hypothetical protein